MEFILWNYNHIKKMLSLQESSNSVYLTIFSHMVTERCYETDIPLNYSRTNKRKKFKG